jgi:hypothetical protein
MSMYEIWAEGYAATGEEGTAKFWGVSEGEDFHEAVQNFASRNPNFGKYLSKDGWYYWGCRLYANEANARSSFG